MAKIENPGRYAATVTSAEFGEAKTGTPFLAVSYATDEGATITGWHYLSEKSIESHDPVSGRKKAGPTLETFRNAFGFNDDWETVIEQIVGKPCSLTIAAETYNGETRLKVKHVDAPRSSRPIDNQSEFLKALSAKAARIPKQAAKAGTAPTRTSKPAVPFA